MWDASMKAFLGHEHNHYVFMIGLRRIERTEWLTGYVKESLGG
jgi:hypothetical protein